MVSSGHSTEYTPECLEYCAVMAVIDWKSALTGTTGNEVGRSEAVTSCRMAGSLLNSFLAWA